jgi:DNA-binding MarR family transcriptional regulator
MPTNNSTAAVLSALGQHPGATVAELADAAGLGRSTAGKALVALERQGKVERRPGGRAGGRNEPDRWALARPGPQRSAERLGRGQLAGLVAGYLASHPGQDLGPGAIGTALGRSSGAVSNALDRLVASGGAILAGASPRRFRSTGP